MDQRLEKKGGKFFQLIKCSHIFFGSHISDACHGLSSQNLVEEARSGYGSKPDQNGEFITGTATLERLGASSLGTTLVHLRQAGYGPIRRDREGS